MIVGDLAVEVFGQVKYSDVTRVASVAVSDVGGGPRTVDRHSACDELTDLYRFEVYVTVITFPRLHAFNQTM